MAAFQQAKLAKDKLLDEIRRLNEERDAHRAQLAELQAQRFDPQKAMDMERFQTFVSQQIAEVQEKVELIEAESQRRLSVVQAKEKEVLALEKLREKQRQEWQERQHRNEQLNLDQWANYQHWLSAKERAAGP